MLRTILSVVAGIAVWFVLVTIADRVMRAEWPAYQAAWSAMAFILPMMIARLTESTVALIVASWAAARIAPLSRAAPWALGIVLLAFFVPVHIMIWSKFPILYHAFFLTSLVAIPAIVGTVGRKSV